MTYYLIAGEASGDLHGSNLLKALKIQDKEAEFRFWGGDQMAEVAGQPVKHISELAFMGFVEVVANLRTILSNIKLCKNDILSFQPDALILIDYPGFNMRIAEFAKENGIAVHYYISPQVWAWKQNRVHKLKKTVDEMYCILPFESDFYKKFDFDVQYVGHPLIDAIENYKSTALSKKEFVANYDLDNRPILALLPGSRKQEIKIKLPIMLEAAKQMKEHQILIAGAPTISAEFYKEISQGTTIKVIPNKTYDLLNNADLAMVTSGTATLETALFKVPQVVCYKGNSISYHIAKRLIKVNYISLVNLIMDQEIVKELIQNELTPENILQELKKFTPEKRTEIQSQYEELRSKLGGGGASEKLASLLIDNLGKKE
ncbi:MAG: lipid-A-disaccharide synthase [Flavobacteriales bacterium]|nr:lipid-A-disaccharide synthase [Flavobacteriales bacterium]